MFTIFLTFLCLFYCLKKFLFMSDIENYFSLAEVDLYLLLNTEKSQKMTYVCVVIKHVEKHFETNLGEHEIKLDFLALKEDYN